MCLLLSVLSHPPEFTRNSLKVLYLRQRHGHMTVKIQEKMEIYI